MLAKAQRLFPRRPHETLSDRRRDRTHRGARRLQQAGRYFQDLVDRHDDFEPGGNIAFAVVRHVIRCDEVQLDLLVVRREFIVFGAELQPEQDHGIPERHDRFRHTELAESKHRYLG